MEIWRPRGQRAAPPAVLGFSPPRPLVGEWTTATLALILTLAVGPPPAVDHALHTASARYGVPYSQLRSVSWCESRWRPSAVGNGSYGLFQFLRGTWARTPYARRSVFDGLANALAAAWLVRRDGGWQEWSCQP